MATSRAVHGPLSTAKGDINWYGDQIRRLIERILVSKRGKYDGNPGSSLARSKNNGLCTCLANMYLCYVSCIVDDGDKSLHLYTVGSRDLNELYLITS
jgi:hypothetical protein